MTTDSSPGDLSITRRHRDLLLAASTLTYLLVTLGGVVCVTSASRGCPDWPGCYGQLVPPMRLDSILEYSHRVLAALTSLSIFVSAIGGWRKYRSIRWVSWPPVIAIGFLLVVIVLGAMVVLRGLGPGLAALDLGSALMVLALMVSATVVAFSRHSNPDQPDRLSLHGSFAKLSLWTLVTVFLVLVSGVLVATTDSVVRCLGWPLYGGRLDLADTQGWLSLARLLVAGVASILVLAVVIQAWRRQRGHKATRCTVAVVGVLLAAEMAVGALMVLYGFAVVLQVIYVAAAAAFWASLVVLVILAGLASPQTTEERSVGIADENPQQSAQPES